MEDFFSRSEFLLGSEAMEKLRTRRVLLFGVGGVGSWCAEALIRTDLIHLTIVDGDTVQPSNINRQLPATRETLNQPKVEALKARLLTINPEAEIKAVYAMYKPTLPLKGEENNKSFPLGEDLGEALSEYDFVIDAIDDVPAKADLIINATRARGVKVFSSLGAALRFDPTAVTTGELMSIKGDALAKAVRARMKKIGLHPYRKVKCVYSTENARPLQNVPEGKEKIKGSLMQVTAVFGCTLASLVIRELIIDN